MANTYTQLYIQIVFAVKGRDRMIPIENKDSVEKYMTGVIQNRNHKLLGINCLPDHTHIFIGLNPDQSISDLVEQTKTAATKYIKKQSWMPFEFSWQRGYGSFSYSRSQIDAVVKYIRFQERHHQKRSFKAEYVEMLEKFDVSFDKRYLFEFY